MSLTIFRCIKCNFHSKFKCVTIYHTLTKHKQRKVPADDDQQAMSLITIDEV